MYKSCLWELLQICPSCSRLGSVEIHHRNGTMVEIKHSCYFCANDFKWQSQPMLGHLAAGNLHISAAILFSGASQTKCLRVFEFLGVNIFTPRTFTRHAQDLLYPTIYLSWQLEQRTILNDFAERGGQLVLACDGRADSPGHSAKYGSYTVLETSVNKIIHQELVQSNEVGSSNAMEKEGCLRSMSFLARKGLTINTVVTDRHPQIQKLLREKMPETKHYFDGWHIGKSLGRNLESIAKEKDCEEVRPWIKSITNHLYWSAASSGGDSELVISKWMSVVEHVQNIHTNCYHAPLADDQRNKKWLKPGSKAAVRLEEVVSKTRFIKDVGKISPQIQTSGVEGYHSLIIQFAPKNVVFGFKSMLARLLLAALHYNYNSSRSQGKNADGSLKHAIRHPKFKKGGYTVVSIKEKCSYEYVSGLIELLFNQVATNPEEFQLPWDAVEVPPPLNSEYFHPEKSVAVKQHVSRYNCEKKVDSGQAKFQ